MAERCPKCGVAWTLGRDVGGAVHTPDGLDCLRNQLETVKNTLFIVYQDTVSPNSGYCFRCMMEDGHDEACFMATVESVLGVTWKNGDWRDAVTDE